MDEMPMSFAFIFNKLKPVQAPFRTLYVPISVSMISLLSFTLITFNLNLLLANNPLMDLASTTG